MKILLYFDISGIHEERTTNSSSFNIKEYEEFNEYREYPGFLVLYNKDSIESSCVNIPFTTDTFNGDILIIKLNKNKKIITFPINKYLGMLNTKKIKIECYSSDSSDEDPISCNLTK